MALYIPHSIFHSARLLYARPETFGPPYYVPKKNGCRSSLSEVQQQEREVYRLPVSSTEVDFE